MVTRRAARVLLFDAEFRILLFRGLDPSRPEAGSWWFTPGGGVEPGESDRDAALREVLEETGAVLPELVGPVYERVADFEFEGEAFHQSEQFFVAKVNEFVIESYGWTDLERRSMLESRWWSLDELESTTETIYPEALADLVRSQLTGP